MKSRRWMGAGALGLFFLTGEVAAQQQLAKVHSITGRSGD
jgi:hypothetical protein